VDLDWHGRTSSSPEANRRAALAWHAELVHRGFRPLLTDSNGRGGYHLLVILSAPAPTASVHHFLKELVDDHSLYGLGMAPETYPKQKMIEPNRFGNWLRLPGRHHTHRDHWSRVWDGSGWRQGHRAVEYILTLTGDPPNLLPEPPTEPERPTGPTVRYRTNAGGDLCRRIVNYMAKLPNLGAGQGRDEVAYVFAAWLVRDLALGDEDALAWLARWDSGNRPPKGNVALAEILANAKRYGRHAVGSGLGRARPGRHARHQILRFEMGVPR
jgi:hypothetical protein